MSHPANKLDKLREVYLLCLLLPLLFKVGDYCHFRQPKTNYRLPLISQDVAGTRHHIDTVLFCEGGFWEFAVFEVQTLEPLQVRLDDGVVLLRPEKLRAELHPRTPVVLEQVFFEEHLHCFIGRPYYAVSPVFVTSVAYDSFEELVAEHTITRAFTIPANASLEDHIQSFARDK